MKIRLAFIISHPIQYYVPLYQRLAARDDIDIKVFFTWHAGGKAVRDRGFNVPVAWDIPLTSGYSFELVPNTARDPGTHHFFGLRNPLLVERVSRWAPDIVHVTGWAWLSHLSAMRMFAKLKLPILFRGDSHLLDETFWGPRWWLKRALLIRVFSWPTAFLVVGSANQAYYETFGVDQKRLLQCPHSIDVSRFAEPRKELDGLASKWRQDLGISALRCVLLFAGKFERKKRPLELMRAVRNLNDPNIALLMVGDGELSNDVRSLAAEDTGKFIVLPFQNQTKMPLVYRMGDLFILPSANNETWGLAVNEALACGRPALVSDRVGCASDLTNFGCGSVFSWEKAEGLECAIRELVNDRAKLANLGRLAADRAWSFDVASTERALMHAVRQINRL